MLVISVSPIILFQYYYYYCYYSNNNNNNNLDNSWLSHDPIAALLVHRTKGKKGFWELGSIIIIQNMIHHLLLF